MLRNVCHLFFSQQKQRCFESRIYLGLLSMLRTVCHLFFSQQKQRCFESSLYSISELRPLSGNRGPLTCNRWPATAGRLAQRPQEQQPATAACGPWSGRRSTGQLPATAGLAHCGRSAVAGPRPGHDRPQGVPLWHQQHHRNCISFLPPTLPVPEMEG